MYRVLILFALSSPVLAQNQSADAPLTQALLTEIRQLRHDLQTTAATIQRVQIVMYRLQAESALMDRAMQRLDQARAACSQGQMQRKRLAAQIEQAETRKRNAQSLSDQKAAEVMLSNLKASDEMWAGQEQECQIEQTEAETEFRAEQAKMNDLQAQLDKLDR